MIRKILVFQAFFPEEYMRQRIVKVLGGTRAEIEFVDSEEEARRRLQDDRDAYAWVFFFVLDFSTDPRRAAYLFLPAYAETLAHLRKKAERIAEKQAGSAAKPHASPVRSTPVPSAFQKALEGIDLDPTRRGQKGKDPP